MAYAIIKIVDYDIYVSTNNICEQIYLPFSLSEVGLSADLPDGDDCDFYDCFDTVQESYGPNTAEAENVGDPPWGTTSATWMAFRLGSVNPRGSECPIVFCN